MDHSTMDHSKMHHGHHMMGDGMEQEAMTHTMAGIPVWMAVAGIAFIIFATHLLLWLRSGKEKPEDYPRFNLFRLPLLGALVKQRWYPLFLQAIPLFLLFLIIYAGLFGSQRQNIATVLTWGYWWALLIFIIVLGGTSFCSICPWEAASSLFSSFSLFSRVKKAGLELKVPSWLKNLYPAIVLFVGLTWLELGFEITRKPDLTAVLAILMTFLAVSSTLVFEKRAFCRHFCLVGRISGLYALFSPFELRSVSNDVCRSCSTKDCMKGKAGETAPCPTGLYPGGLRENTYCTLCTECVRSCPSDNLALNLRPPAADLYIKRNFRKDESVLALVLLSLTSFHGLTMTPLWTELVNGLRLGAGIPKLASFTILMTVVMLLPFMVYRLAVSASSFFSGSSRPGELFQAFAYPLIPVALFYHLAHNGMHFFAEAEVIVPLLSDPLGQGFDLFGTRDYAPGMLVAHETIWWIQLAFVLTGHVYGVIVADRIAGRIFPDRKTAIRGLLPQMIFMILFSGISIWLIAQPMEMRTGM